MNDPASAAVTWHHGLMARWWAEFVEAEPDELAWYRSAIARFGEPALDLGCGAGRLLVPLLREGLDVDGADVSADMLAQAARLAAEVGSTPRLYQQAVHQLRTERRYRTIFACGVIGIGVSRAQDLAGFRQVYEQLEPGGAFVIGHTLPTEGMSPESWAHWLPHEVGELPRPWRDEWEEKAIADGDRLRLLTRLADLRPVEQRLALEMQMQLVREDVVVAEESHRLTENLYFAPELLLMLEVAGFREVEMAAAYGGEPVFDQPAIVITGRRPA